MNKMHKYENGEYIETEELNNIVTEAFDYALYVHNENTFVFDHQYKVAMLMYTLINTRLPNISDLDKQILLAACYLHDVLEDTDVTYETLCIKFGKPVADLVHEVTDNGRNNTFPRLHTKYGFLIKYCDRIINLSRRISKGNESALNDHYYMKSIFWNR